VHLTRHLPRPPQGLLFSALLAALLLVGIGMGPAPLDAQTPADAAASPRSPHEWNDPEVLALVDRGRTARRELRRDGDLESYHALTEGHVYFFVDPEEGEPSLIRVDQVAVELRWRAPDLVRQRIVGERSETRLPVRDFQYYLDRLTLVQYGFGDEIQVGSGMDVSGVPHPLAEPPGLEIERSAYDFRISDSLTLRLPGGDEPLRLTEVEVRPRDAEAPRAMGTLLLDSTTGSIVRMSLSFTPASYVDRRTDRIEVEVDYGLWEGRYWLPNRQIIEVRREMPELDLGVGTVIRAVLRVGDYELNAPVPEAVEARPAVVWAPAAERADYPFAEDLLAGLERDGVAGLDTRPNPRRIRAEAERLLEGQSATGLRPLRLHLPRFSSFLRYNRAEGVFVGSGATLQPSPALRVRTHGGVALGPGLGSGAVRVDGIWGDDHGWNVGLSVNELEDLGLRAGASLLASSLGATFRGEDYLDPLRRSSLLGGVVMGLGSGWRVRLDAGVERDRSWQRIPERAPLDRARPFRSVRPVSDGAFLLARPQALRGFALPADGRGTLTLGLEGRSGLSDEGRGLGSTVEIAGRWASPTGSRELAAHLEGWSWHGSPLPQAHRLMGGRGTVPGYPFRSWAGQSAAVGSLEGAVDLGSPLVRVRGGAHLGWTGRLDEETAEAWEVETTGGVRPALSAGLGLGWDVLRVEGAYGLRDGEWQLLFSVDPRWWDQL
jgi:hypothetical protein